MNSLRVVLHSGDPQLAVRFRRNLRHLGHSLAEVITASSPSPSQSVNGAEGVEDRGLPPGLQADVLIADCRTAIPEEAWQFRAWNVPTIVLLAPGRPELVGRVLRGGAGAVLAEPITRAALQMALITALARAANLPRHPDLASRAARNEQHLRWLQEAARAMAQCETLDHVLGLAADHIQQGLGYDRIGITLIDEQRGLVREWLNTDREGRRFVREGPAFSLDESSPLWGLRLYQELVREGKDFFYSANAWDEHPDELRYLADGQPRENLIVPMRTGGRLWGYISVDNLLSGRRLGPEDAPTLLAFAQETAVAISKAALQLTAERRAQELATLMEVSIAVAAQRNPQAACRVAVDQLVCRFGYEMVSSFLRDGDDLLLQAQHGFTTVLDPMPLQRGICARTTRLGVPQLVRDVRLDPDYFEADSRVLSELCVPIVIGDQVAGVLNVETSRPDVLDEQAQELLVLLARQVAVVVENARLNVDIQRRISDLAWLQQATRELLRCDTTAQVVEQAADSFQQGLGIDRVGIARFDATQLTLCDWLATDQQGRRRLTGHQPLSLKADSPAWSYPPLRAILQDGADYGFTAHAREICSEPLLPWLDGPVTQHLVVALRTALPGVGDQSAVIGMIGLDNLLTGRPLQPDLFPVVVAYANQIAMALDRTWLLETERRRAHLAENLERAASVIASSLDADQIFEQVLDLLRDIVEFDTATVLLVENGVVRPLAGSQAAYDPFLSDCALFAAKDDPILSRWLAPGVRESVLIPDTQLDPRWRLLASGNTAYMDRVRCYLCAPLVIDGVLVGALSLAKYTPHSFDSMSLAATAAFADRLSQALRNARLYDLERTANARLQSVARLQDDFVATISHELRTPLTSILGFAENLLAHWGLLDDMRRRLSVEKVHRAGTRLDRLVGDLLHLSRIDTGALRIVAARHGAGPLLAQAIEELQIKYKGQQVEVAPALEHAVVWADGERLRQVLLNLLDNAAKYSPEGSPISITWETDDTWGILGINDCGPGIRTEDIPRLFQRFGKLDTVTRAGHVGTGLGLYICKQYIEAMDGQIWYEDGHDSGTAGASFRIRLPLSLADSAARSISRAPAFDPLQVEGQRTAP